MSFYTDNSLKSHWERVGGGGAYKSNLHLNTMSRVAKFQWTVVRIYDKVILILSLFFYRIILKTTSHKKFTKNPKIYDKSIIFFHFLFSIDFLFYGAKLN
jgi:hypothetical protein